MGLWNYRPLLARDEHILIITAYCYTSSVYTIAASLHESPLVTDSLLLSLLQSLLESLLERAALQEE